MLINTIRMICWLSVVRGSWNHQNLSFFFTDESSNNVWALPTELWARYFPVWRSPGSDAQHSQYSATLLSLATACFVRTWNPVDHERLLGCLEWMAEKGLFGPLSALPDGGVNAQRLMIHH